MLEPLCTHPGPHLYVSTRPLYNIASKTRSHYALVQADVAVLTILYITVDAVLACSFFAFVLLSALCASSFPLDSLVHLEVSWYIEIYSVYLNDIQIPYK